MTKPETAVWQIITGAVVVDGEDERPRVLYLTDGEGRVLAAAARYKSQEQDDFRYMDPDPVERERLRQRWREIADALHPDPYGAGS